MIRSAALQLRSVVLVDSDADDDTLGIFFPSENATAVRVQEPANESPHATQPS
jgi:hypothetical protein